MSRLVVSIRGSEYGGNVEIETKLEVSVSHCSTVVLPSLLCRDLAVEQELTISILSSTG